MLAAGVVYCLGSRNCWSTQTRCKFLAKTSRMTRAILPLSWSTRLPTMPSNIGITYPDQLMDYNPAKLDESVLWTLDRRFDDDYRAVRAVDNIHLNLDGFENIPDLSGGVPVILDVTTFSIKLQKRRLLVLECLNQEHVDGSSGSSYGPSGSCSSCSNNGAFDFDVLAHF
ncbi:elongator complex protein 4 [Tanacetum coccineum]|uniref:Elongator complex protein 4 n=1 Tax=Tanacetum coccineum TaxID=301880 RepID=A0ABQ5GHJ0_9ASTR